MKQGKPKTLEPDLTKFENFLKDDLPEIHYRQEVFEVIDFLKQEDESKRVLDVIGRSRLRKLNIVLKAVYYCHDHYYSFCDDGAYFFDLRQIENNIKVLYEKINKEL